MKIKIKLDLYVLKEYFIATICGKQNGGEGLSKVTKRCLKWGRGGHPNLKLIPKNKFFSTSFSY